MPRSLSRSAAKRESVSHQHSHQSDTSIEKNTSFFRDHRHDYNERVQALDTYLNIRAHVDASVRGIDRMLDLGNGGVFDYDASLVGSIVALDLFLEDLHHTEDIPTNAALKNGSALDIPEPEASFDGVLMVMLLHHLVGRTVRDCYQNARTAIAEALRVLRPGGKLVIVESCVPPWFYAFERAVFPVAAPLINALLPHPATLQFPPEVIVRMLAEHQQRAEITRIPKGAWVLQYGYKFPGALTPIQPYRFVVHKQAPG